MSNTVRLPEGVNTPGAFSDWLRSLGRLASPLNVWSQFVFSRYSPGAEPEQVGDFIPGARRQHRHLPLFTLSRRVGGSHEVPLNGWFVVLDLPDHNLHKIVTVADR